ncbi:MAG: hypothetical protein P1U41_02850 [Vicingaceae bacterium]|nr:hypothetical protein [Vicingaceae bacterium]
MEFKNTKHRLLAVKLTEELFSEKISLDKYLVEFPEDNDDEDLIELYALIEQEPPVAAFGGESKLKQHSNMNRISELLQSLRG